MPARRGDLQSPLYVFLAHDVLEVRQAPLLRRRGPYRGGGQGGFVFQMGHQGAHIRHAVDRQSFRQGGFSGIVRRDEEGADTGVPGGQGHGQHAGDGPEGPGKAQFPQKGGVLRRRGQFSRGGQQAHEDGQVVDRARLFGARRGQVHGDAADGELGSAVFHRRPDPLPGLPDGGVRQTHDVKGRQAAGEKALGGDLVSGNAGETQGTNGGDHGGTSLRKNVKNL